MIPREFRKVFSSMLVTFDPIYGSMGLVYLPIQFILEFYGFHVSVNSEKNGWLGDVNHCSEKGLFFSLANSTKVTSNWNGEVGSRDPNSKVVKVTSNGSGIIRSRIETPGPLLPQSFPVLLSR